MEKGWKTSEFWMSLGSAAVSVAVALGFASAETEVRAIFASASAVIPSLYGLYRTLLKRDEIMVYATVEAATIEADAAVEAAAAE